jgi:hypothetical protein
MAGSSAGVFLLVYVLFTLMRMGAVLAGTLTSNWIEMAFSKTPTGQSCVIRSSNHTGYEYSGVILNIRICDGSSSCETWLMGFGLFSAVVPTITLLISMVAALVEMREHSAPRKSVKVLAMTEGLNLLAYGLSLAAWLIYSNAIPPKQSFTWLCHSWSWWLYYAGGMATVLILLIFAIAICILDEEDEEDAITAAKETQRGVMLEAGTHYEKYRPYLANSNPRAPPPATSFAENLQRVQSARRGAPQAPRRQYPQQLPPFAATRMMALGSIMAQGTVF